MAKKNNAGAVIATVIVLCVVVAIIAAVGGFTINAPTEYRTQYDCDLKLVSIGMDVDVKDTNSEKSYKINGEFFNTYEDDLAMKDLGGDIVKTSDDNYNFISQNNHIIMSGENIEYICDGKIKIFADSYDVFDADGNKVAFVEFNMFDTVGVMVDNAGNEIARYDSAAFGYDYVISIFDGCEIDDESILMIFASYVSDKQVDNN